MIERHHTGRERERKSKERGKGKEEGVLFLLRVEKELDQERTIKRVKYRNNYFKWSPKMEFI